MELVVTVGNGFLRHLQVLWRHIWCHISYCSITMPWWGKTNIALKLMRLEHAIQYAFIGRVIGSERGANGLLSCLLINSFLFHSRLYPRRRNVAGCPSGGGIKNGHIRYPSCGGTQKPPEKTPPLDYRSSCSPDVRPSEQSTKPLQRECAVYTPPYLRDAKWCTYNYWVTMFWGVDTLIEQQQRETACDVSQHHSHRD